MREPRPHRGPSRFRRPEDDRHNTPHRQKPPRQSSNAFAAHRNFGRRASRMFCAEQEQKQAAATLPNGTGGKDSNLSALSVHCGMPRQAQMRSSSDKDSKLSELSVHRLGPEGATCPRQGRSFGDRLEDQAATLALGRGALRFDDLLFDVARAGGKCSVVCF